MHQPTGLDCRIEQLQATREECQAHHEQTRPWSPFNCAAYARLHRGETVVGVAFGQRVELDGAGGVSQHPLEADERQRVLIDELGMREEIVHRLPEDIPTPPPPGSRTARGAV